MTSADLMEAMMKAGAPMEAILIAVRAMEEQRDEVERRRTLDRERKRRQRDKDRDGDVNVTGQSRDMSGDIPGTVTDETSLSLPPNENISNPPALTHGRETPRARKADPFPCPNGVDPLDWSSLIAQRKAKRSPMNDGAYRQIVGKLDRWAEDGWPPGPIVANAVERGWLTVFETDEMKNGHLGRNNGTAPKAGRGGTIRDALEDLREELIASGDFRPGGQTVPAINGHGHGGIGALPAPDRAIGNDAGGPQGVAARRLC